MKKNPLFYWRLAIMLIWFGGIGTILSLISNDFSIPSDAWWAVFPVYGGILLLFAFVASCVDVKIQAAADVGKHVLLVLSDAVIDYAEATLRFQLYGVLVISIILCAFALIVYVVPLFLVIIPLRLQSGERIELHVKAIIDLLALFFELQFNKVNRVLA